jgi:hypothetical protein
MRRHALSGGYFRRFGGNRIFYKSMVGNEGKWFSDVVMNGAVDFPSTMVHGKISSDLLDGQTDINEDATFA